MRYLIFTLLGFFGPALLMLLLRLIWWRIRYRLLRNNSEPEIIDVTPKHKPGRLFMLSWLLISIICTALLIWQMDDSPAPEQVYIPAHIDAYGNFVPAQTIRPELPSK